LSRANLQPCFRNSCDVRHAVMVQYSEPTLSPTRRLLLARSVRGPASAISRRLQRLSCTPVSLDLHGATAGPCYSVQCNATTAETRQGLVPPASTVLCAPSLPTSTLPPPCGMSDYGLTKRTSSPLPSAVTTTAKQCRTVPNPLPRKRLCFWQSGAARTTPVPVDARRRQVTTGTGTCSCPCARRVHSCVNAAFVAKSGRKTRIRQSSATCTAARSALS
jgi:hypothetical protein